MTDRDLSRGQAPTAASTYEATADHFDAPALSFWDRFGRRTVERAGVDRGHRVLDVCCGTGASAIPAAAAVGPTGSVIGVDLSEPALRLARAKADALALQNVELVSGDFRDVPLDDAAFDDVICVFGIFFLDDMAAGAAHLWRLVRPGGRLAVTIWGPDLFEPATTTFWHAVAAERPDLVHNWHPWTRLTDVDGLRDLLGGAGIPADATTVEAEVDRHPLTTPEDWWTIVLGTGYRATVDQLAPDAAERARVATTAELAARGTDAIVTDVVYGIAHKAL